jgi:uncharacterized membrane protein
VPAALGSFALMADLFPHQAERAPGILLGIGLGGFVDGIVLHQILQWHHLLSATDEHPVSTIAGLEANTLADGLFHAATWIAVAVGLYVLWRRVAQHPRLSGRALIGWMLFGWGLFNLVEGLVDHQILGLHHVRETGNQTAWDLGFLTFGVVLMVVGALLNETRRAGRSGEQSVVEGE